jgi:hypothetical protein
LERCCAEGKDTEPVGSEVSCEVNEDINPKLSNPVANEGVVAV